MRTKSPYLRNPDGLRDDIAAIPVMATYELGKFPFARFGKTHRRRPHARPSVADCVRRASGVLSGLTLSYGVRITPETQTPGASPELNPGQTDTAPS